MRIASCLDTYEAALAFMDSLDAHNIRPGLSRIQAVLETLGNPQDQLSMVHIAGTNGKGSTTAILSSILKAAGASVGSFTSPHLVHLRERIAINGNPILPDEFQYEVGALKEHLETRGFPPESWPSYFEFLNIVAYRYFQRKNVQITVFETGLGGRLDSTNVVKHPNLTVITGIGLDHMARLGTTLSDIAFEKAGILKPGSPLVLGPHVPPEALAVIRERAEALEISMIQADSESLEILPDSNPQEGLHVRHSSGLTYRLSLLGRYQKNNLATVLACVQQLRQQGVEISEAAVCEGLRQARWPARFQVLDSQSILLDGSHNEDGFQSLADSLKFYFPQRPLFWLLSLRRDRSPELLQQLVRNFPQSRGVICTCAEPVDKYHAPADLKAYLSAITDVSIVVAETPKQALSRLRDLLAEHKSDQPLGVITGSLYTAGALLSHID